MQLSSVFQLGTLLLILRREAGLVFAEDFGGPLDTTLARWHLEVSFLR